MSALIELRIKGDARAFLEAGMIAGFITPPSGRAETVGTHESPIRLILRGGETLDVYGESVAQILLRAAMVRKDVRERGLDIKCDMLDPIPHDGADAQLPISSD